MKSVIKKSDKKAAFTIVELLTVMSIIVILIGLLVPAMNQVKKYAKEVKQRVQFKSIGDALEFFSGEFQNYPDSAPKDIDGNPYCGAMKLAEAMVGKDLMGFHPDSVFKRNGEDFTGRQLYASGGDMSARKNYLTIENANAYRIEDIYSNYTDQQFIAGSILLCDEFGQVTNRNTGMKMGMPILYYKASPTKTKHDVSDPANSIYNYLDNQALLLLGKPWDSSSSHKLATEGTPGARFYENTLYPKVTTIRRPFKNDTYILASAGNDGEYGTSDDIYNFDFRYRELP